MHTFTTFRTCPATIPRPVVARNTEFDSIIQKHGLKTEWEVRGISMNEMGNQFSQNQVLSLTYVCGNTVTSKEMDQDNYVNGVITWEDMWVAADDLIRNSKNPSRNTVDYIRSFQPGHYMVFCK